jgi:hypothetical protein
VLYFNVDLLSTFYKVKSENNLSDGSFNLGHFNVDLLSTFIKLKVKIM